MATTQPFNAFALYPGGQGKCGIVFQDPQIAETKTTKKVTIHQSQILPLIWNMKEWNVSLSAEMDLASNGETPATFYGNLTLEGKFQELNASIEDVFGSVEFNYIVTSTGKEPYEKVCGSFSKREYQSSLFTDISSEELKERLFVRAGGTIGGTFGYTGSDSGSVEGGHFSISGEANGTPSESDSITAAIGVKKIWVKNDGYCDVYFDVGFVGGTIYTAAASNGFGTVIGNADCYFMGEPFSLPLYAGISESTLNSASLSFNVTVSEYWEYES